MKYAYWGVICKTPDCGLIPAKFIGPYDPLKFLYEKPDNLPASWTIPCSGCGKSYHYTPNDLLVKALSLRPPPEFRPWW